MFNRFYKQQDPKFGASYAITQCYTTYGLTKKNFFFPKGNKIGCHISKGEVNERVLKVAFGWSWKCFSTNEQSFDSTKFSSSHRAAIRFYSAFITKSNMCSQ